MEHNARVRNYNYSMRAKPEGCSCGFARVHYTPDSPAWFVAYKVSVDHRAISCCPHNRAISYMYIHTGGALIYIIGRLQTDLSQRGIDVYVGTINLIPIHTDCMDYAYHMQ